MATPTPIITGDLAAAIQEIELNAVKGAELKTVNVEVDDGTGAKQSVPVLVVPGAFGATIHPLLDVTKQGADWAKTQRLAKADGPDRRQGTAVHHTLASFIQHAKRFKAPNSAIWANAQARQLVSVLDYHEAGFDKAARWGQHRGVYGCPLSEAWLAWGGVEGRKLDQDAFAQLLDSRDRELAEGDLPGGGKAPAPSTLVTLANNLEVFSSATTKRERDANTGRVKLSFSEEKGPIGSVPIPSAFLVQIPIFQDQPAKTLEVRLRVEVEDGEATFALRIQAAGDVLRNAFDSLCEAVGVSTEIPVFAGQPEM